MGRALRDAREARGLTVNWLASGAAITRRELAALEAGSVQEPGLAAIARIARLCNVSLGLFALHFSCPQEARLPRGLDELEVPAAPHLGGAKALGAMVRSKRLALNWTQEILAERMGVSETYVSNLELGRGDPTMMALARAAHALSGTPSTRRAIAIELAGAFTGEVAAPPLRRMYADTLAPRHEPA